MSTNAVVDDLPAKAPVPFYASRWTTRSLTVALVAISFWRLSATFDHRWIRNAPWVISLVLLSLIPELFVLLFPILTRIPRGRFYIPPFRKCLVEFGIATLVLTVVMLIAAIANFLLDHFWPGTSLEPEQFTRLSESPSKMLMYLLLLFTFTFAPVAEELFFRGFLQNSLRARMPRVLAILAQSLIFGFSHSFSVLHSVAASFMGLILALVYEWRRTLITPILIHAGSNALAALSVVLLAAAYASSPVLGVGGDSHDSTCVVRQIVPNSAAEKAGLLVNDVILTFNTQPMRDFRQLARTVRLYKPGDTIPVGISRLGRQLTLNVVLQRRDQ